MKDLKISKELLSEVLKLDAVSHSLLNKLTNCFNLTYTPLENNPYTRSMSINIYEFVFMCKEWALTKGYFIYSTNELSFIKSFSLETIETFSNGKDTEIECILKACEYVLKELINESNRAIERL